MTSHQTELQDQDFLERVVAMTTKVTVAANHGWPVEVTAIHPKDGTKTPAPTVAPGEQRDFYVHDGCDLHIHEVQPHEVDKK